MENLIVLTKDSADGPAHLPPIFHDAQLALLVDPVLQADDVNNDGQLDYAEFIAAQLRIQRGSDLGAGLVH